MLPLIGEWHPSSTGNTPEFFAVLLLGLGGILWTGIRVPIGRLLLLLVLLGLAFQHVRHQATFVIVAVLVDPALAQFEAERREGAEMAPARLRSDAGLCPARADDSAGRPR